LKDDREMKTVMTVVDDRLLGLLSNWSRKACPSIRQMSELFLSQTHKHTNTHTHTHTHTHTNK